MLNSTEKILKAGLGEHVFSDIDLRTLFDGSPQSRYGLVNKALKKGELIRLKRGLYMLAQEYQKELFSKYYFAARIMPHSYISLESALAYHGWIPERVPDIYSVANSTRTLRVSSPVGLFIFYPVPMQQYEFFAAVTRAFHGEKPFFIASPLKALADLVYLRKLKKYDVDYLINSLRIDEEHLAALTLQDFEELVPVYYSGHVVQFLKNLKKELIK